MENFEDIKSRRFTDGGSLFFDRSMLAHAMGEYRFQLGRQQWTYLGRPMEANARWGEVVVGGNVRQYVPNSGGTIFRDTGDVTIRNFEFGVFTGLEKQLVPEKLKATVTLRMDKNQNFNAILSPAASFVYTARPDQIFRLSFSSAVRNPHLGRSVLSTTTWGGPFFWAMWRGSSRPAGTVYSPFPASKPTAIRPRRSLGFAN